MYRFCNFGHCFDFRPEEKIAPYPNKPQVTNLDFYLDKVRFGRNKAIYILDEMGYELDKRGQPIIPAPVTEE